MNRQLTEGSLLAAIDLGSNSLFLENAVKLGVDITDIDSVIISHGHNTTIS
jgi:metal-dependent hydrolase (beta-lactamase superfamily II)